MRVRTFLQSGQTLVLFLGFAAALVGALLIAFNSGQTTNAKMRAMNAADAAAYSGAVWQARTLNFQAYTNRAMVANEVAIAQSVSLRSWVSYVDSFVNNGPMALLKIVPYLGEALIEVGSVIKEVDQAVQSALPIAEIALRGINQLYYPAQEIMNLSGTVVAQDLAKNVAQQNGAQLSNAAVELFAKNELAWIGFTDSYIGTRGGKVGSDRRTRLREVTLLSRDGFTYSRNWSIGVPFVFKFRKQGGTDLIDFDAWKGLDSSQVQTGWTPKGWLATVPTGWGGAQAYNPNKVSKAISQTGDWNSIDGRLAQGLANGQNAKNIETPFPNYRDIKNPTVKDADLHLPFVVEVVINRAQIKTSDDPNIQGKAILHDGTIVDPAPNFASGNAGVFALSSACVRFSRPYGSDRAGGIEYPSLFNPYWRASLATNSAISRGIVDAVKGLAPVAAIIDGSGSCN
ncbi:pilus assembly protein TadG-related protein [Collimonas sp. NPDC087041]|uniref:pilus assembly protein TadG-related protein n=1 Tax=Collimonas sp. NPDC087041 TaxID=3363960 RepID=UPI0037F74FBA